MAEVKSNMTGSVFQLKVNVGDKVEAGQEVVILESMKMEIPIQAEEAGTVKEIKVDIGDFVNEGDTVVVTE